MRTSDHESGLEEHGGNKDVGNVLLNRPSKRVIFVCLTQFPVIHYTNLNWKLPFDILKLYNGRKGRFSRFQETVGFLVRFCPKSLRI